MFLEEKMGYSDHPHTLVVAIVVMWLIEDVDVVVDFGFVPLWDALSYPHDVSTLLLFQLSVGIEDTEVKLLHEGVDVQRNLCLKGKKM